MIAIILVNWNGHKDTIECLESLVRLSSGDFIALVVDNGSTNGSVEAIVDWSQGAEWTRPEGAPWNCLPVGRVRPVSVTCIGADGDISTLRPGSIALVETGANLGFAGANNIAMRIARRDPRISHFWLLNNDTVVTPDCADKMLAALSERPGIAILGARLMYYHMPEVVQGVAGYYSMWLASGGHIGFNVAVVDLPKLEEIEREMSYVMGASMFLPVSTYDVIGPMAEEYFLYFEELDWAERLKRTTAGRQSVALDAVVYHKEGGSIGTSNLKKSSETSLYFLNRSLISFMKKWHKILLFSAICRVFINVAYHLKQKDLRAARVIFSSLFSNRSGLR
jgi:GT2 family glycosyltransferase